MQDVTLYEEFGIGCGKGTRQFLLYIVTRQIPWEGGWQHSWLGAIECYILN